MKLYNLSDLDREIISVATLEEDLSVARLARTLKKREHTVRDALERLIRDDVLRRVWLIDVLQLGLLRFQILLGVGARKRTERESLLQHLISHTRVPFLADLGGEFDYEFVALCRSALQLRTLLEDLSEISPRPYHRKDVSIQDNLHLFNRKHFSKRGAMKHVTLGGKLTRQTIDEKDHEILKAIQNTPLATKHELARIVGVSEVTIATRMKRLSQKRIIAGSSVRVNGTLLGLSNAKLLVRSRALSRTHTEKLLSFAAKHPLVTNFRECLAESDYELGVEYRDPLELKQLKDELLDRFETMIENIEVLPRFRVQKYRMYPFSTYREYLAEQ